MSCIFCVNYKKINEYCEKGILIENTYESFDCKFYSYNGELKEMKE